MLKTGHKYAADQTSHSLKHQHRHKITAAAPPPKQSHLHKNVTQRIRQEAGDQYKLSARRQQTGLMADGKGNSDGNAKVPPETGQT